MKTIFEQAKVASQSLNMLSDSTINQVLNNLAELTEQNFGEILAANQLDLDQMEPENPKFDRLKLTKQRIFDIANDIRNVAKLPSPLGQILEEKTRPNGMHLTKISVPFGVIGIIFEARPNVNFDVFSLCLKSGNVCILKGGSDAQHSNAAIVKIIKNALKQNGLNENCVTLLPNDRTATEALLKAVGDVDLIIPRGGKQLIEFVRNNAKVPVIETGAGICHTYFDEFGNVEKGKNIVTNAKTRRVSVCNALDCLVVHKKRLADLPKLCENLAEKNVTIFADNEAFNALKGNYPENLLQHATEEHFGTEFLDYKMAIKTVETFSLALEHIAYYSSKHSECIVSENQELLTIFNKTVDAACVYNNVSTAFTDGAQFGLGAEIGISTQKLHARGPMALRELTTYKWIIAGNGQTRI